MQQTWSRWSDVWKRLRHRLVYRIPVANEEEPGVSRLARKAFRGIAWPLPLCGSLRSIPHTLRAAAGEAPSLVHGDRWMTGRTTAPMCCCAAGRMKSGSLGIEAVTV